MKIENQTISDVQDIDIQNGTFEIAENITEISEYAFWNCTLLETIIIPKNISKIERCAFRNCLNLKEIIFQNMECEINYEAFSHTGLISIELPFNLKEIPASCFSFCKHLRNINIPKNIQRIGDLAFLECNNLEEINLPSSLTYINDTMFFQCKNLKTLYWNGKKYNYEDLKTYESFNANAF